MNNFHSLTDSDLIALLKSDRSAVFSEIYNRHWETLYQSAFNILKDKDCCLDIVQDVFISLWKNENLNIVSLRGYLIAAVKYQVANYLRHGKVKQFFFEEVQQSHQHSAFFDTSLEVKELKEIIYHFTNALPERSRLIFKMSRNEHMTNKQISEELGISEKTVENQITIVLRKLRMKLGSKSFLLTFFI